MIGEIDFESLIHLIKSLNESEVDDVSGFLGRAASIYGDETEPKFVLYKKKVNGLYERVAASFETLDLVPFGVSEKILVSDQALLDYSPRGYFKIDSLTSSEGPSESMALHSYLVVRFGDSHRYLLVAIIKKRESLLTPRLEILSILSELLRLKLQNVPDETLEPFKGLTLRQSRVLEMVLRGKTNKEVASKIGVSVPTIKQDLTEIYRAFGVSNRTALSRAMNRSSNTQLARVVEDGLGQISTEKESLKGGRSANS